MIQLSLPRPATPAQLHTPEVRAQVASIAQKVTQTPLCSADFTAFWGNHLSVLQLTEKILKQLNPALPAHIIAALQALVGHVYQGERAFNRAVKSALSAADYKDHKRRLCTAAETQTVAHTLWHFQQHKCCYCEHTISWKLESDVEHFRPKTRIQGVPQHPGYWWLAYAWDNYFLACKICNTQYKGNQFPLAENGQRAQQPTEDLTQEKALLLHPILDNPEHSIRYEITQCLVKAVATDARGQATITQLTGINDVSRMEARAHLVPGLAFICTQMQRAQDSGENKWIDECAACIRAESADKQTFAGFRRFYFRTQELAEYLA